MTSPVASSVSKPKDEEICLTSCPAKQPQKPGVQAKGGKAAAGSAWEIQVAPSKPQPQQVPPCLVNMLIDPGNPAFFAMGGDDLAYLEGGPGSCLDFFKTHVRDTVGVDVFLRAMGAMTQDALVSFCGKALAIQGHDPAVAKSAAPALGNMMASAAIILLENEVASRVIGKLEIVGAAASALAGSEELRLELLDRICDAGAGGPGKKVLEALGLGEHDADEVISLASQGKEGMEEAQTILLDGLADLEEEIADLESEIATWPMSKEIDLLADLGPEVSAALHDMGMPKQQKGSALDAAIKSHVADAGKSHMVNTGVKLLLHAAAGMVAGGLIAHAAAALPGLAADAGKLEDMELLHAVGSASDQAVAEARNDLALAFVAALVPLPHVLP